MYKANGFCASGHFLYPKQNGVELHVFHVFTFTRSKYDNHFSDVPRRPVGSMDFTRHVGTNRSFQVL
jgi:hypothetical protein